MQSLSDLAELAETVRSARRLRNWGQQELAAAAQVSLGVISNLERKKTRPQPANERAILDALDIAPVEDDEADDDGEARHWSRDVSVVLDVMGMYLESIPDDRREAQIHAITRYVFGLARDQGPY